MKLLSEKAWVRAVMKACIVELPAKAVLMYCWLVMFAANEARGRGGRLCVAGFWKVDAHVALKAYNNGEMYCAYEAGSACWSMAAV